MTDWDDDEVAEAAALWGVSPSEAEDMLEVVGSPFEEEPEPTAAELAEEAREEETEAAIDEEAGLEVDEEELEHLADLWGVEPNDVEDLLEQIDVDFDVMSFPEVREYIDSLYEYLESEGWDVDVSDLWDMFYGYSPGGGEAA